ncbi:TIGR03086 family metal-binding protein [Pseudonocardia sp. MH-G8]|uniref:TIGR03086 family metal-binding protein n=1 Tax=Pseudonocardia sp. MH-G8 TaxID=1854588 RepID=UPI000BA0AD75|nr:TIGR03086 family metal-binding protein [Pseudonocardia sp. MH-G8]OZM82611.1 TIGR03086 family protein [Pseudonocardia sp. MH-G8]
MTTTETTDPRPLYDSALSWTLGVMRSIRSEQLSHPTPCSELDVRGLLAHLVATVHRTAAAGRGEDAGTVPWSVPPVPGDDWSRAYADAIDSMWTVWRAADAPLDGTVRAPFGTVPGRAALMAYTSETLVHGWDLAVATGQDVEADDPAVAAAALAAMQHALPAEPRGGPVPFAAPVPPRADAGPTERLANWCGHARP